MVQGRTIEQGRPPVADCHGDAGLRARVHGMWAGVARSWGEQTEYVETRAAEATARMLELAAPQPGQRVLELACGAGGLGLAAAERVRPGGEVVLSDVVPEMVATAGARARALRLANVSARALDLEDIDEPDAAYDVVLVREGLMLAVDPARAAREIRRVLRPGGRVAVAVWGPRARNPWLGLVFDAVSSELGKPVPPPGVPNPFSLDDAGRLASALRAGGLSEVVVEELPAPVRVGSFDEWWGRTRALAGPLTSLLAELPPPALRSLEGRLRDAVVPYRTPEGLEIPGVVLIASARAGNAPRERGC